LTTDLIVPEDLGQVATIGTTTNDILKIAEKFSKSKLVQSAKGGYSEDDLFVLFLIARSVGISAVSALKDVFFIDGKPMISAAASRGLIRRAGHRYEIVEWSSQVCRLRCWRKGETEPYETEYTREEAHFAGLTSRKNWAQHPKKMIFAAATRQMVQVVYPDLLIGVGVYDRDEFDETPSQDLPKRQSEATISLSQLTGN